MRHFTSGILALSMIAVGSIAASAQVELKLGHAAPDTDLQQNLSVYFADKVKERTNGAVVVKIFPHGQLGNDEQMITGVRSGIIDIEISGLNNLNGLNPKVGALELPYMIQAREHAYKVFDGRIGQELSADFKKQGMKVLGYPENGFRNITNSKRPVGEPKDVAGLRMRTNNSKPLNEMFALLKANPQQIPVAELYTALETGVVDAQEHPISITYSFKLYEVQKYLSLSQHSYSALIMIMNLKKFDSLTPEQQQIILTTAKEAVELQRKLSVDKEEGFIKELEEKGMKVERNVDIDAFQKAAMPTWEGYIKSYGDTLIKEIEAAK